MKKYIKPKSMTFWASIIPLVSGIAMLAGKSIPAVQPVADLLSVVYGTDNGAALLNAGLVGIGLRAAL